MKLTPFLQRFGFHGVTELPTGTFSPNEVKRAAFTKVDVAVIRKAFGKAKLHDPKTGRFVFVLSPTKALRIDTVNKRVVLANGKPIVQRLLKTLER